MEDQPQKIQPEGGSLFQGSSAHKMTDKGFHWKLENLAKDFTATITQWRKQANEIQVLLSDSKDTQEIRNGRNMLMVIMSRFEATYSTIDAHFTDRNGKAAEGTRTLEEFQGKYDGIANDHHTVLRNITSCLQDLEFDSASRNSSRTLRSRSSRTSWSSHLSRTSRKSTEAIIEVAALKAKLKYIDVKAKHWADLEKIKMQRQIDVAQAKLDVLESTQDSNLNMEELPSEVDTNRQVREFWKLNLTWPNLCLGILMTHLQLLQIYGWWSWHRAWQVIPSKKLRLVRILLYLIWTLTRHILYLTSRYLLWQQLATAPSGLSLTFVIIPMDLVKLMQ